MNVFIIFLTAILRAGRSDACMYPDLLCVVLVKTEISLVKILLIFPRDP